ncbi:Outer membrane protein W [Microbulbifer donghaiensis]|uniref:Outer membrane protein W n=1 Tax=Microbulbifer donghaiensis TaxID=494016 RepID=A0A1M4WBP4_9GAMM|nr:OmpW family outer membrane protein [Microbulbifer donghaiensis]SHE78617.1 Outer membrane protein W [Microbulbifer donghaiensis]
MRLKSLLIPLAMAGYAGFAAHPALAGPSGYPAPPPPQGIYTAGTFMVRIGASFVDPDDDVLSHRQVFVTDDPTTDPVEAVPVDVFTKVDLDDDTTWYVSGVWLPIEHFGIELNVSVDANLEATLFSSASTGGEFIGSFSERIGDFDTYTTSLYANWYPMNPTCLIQPYVGLGVSYVDIEEDFLRPVFRDGRERFGLVDFGSDFNWTAQVGVDFNFGRDSGWQVNLAAMYVRARPDISIGYDTETFVPGFGDSVILPVRVRDELDMDPWIVNLGVGYRFSF